MDFSRADAALMASSGMATSLSFFRYIIMDETQTAMRTPHGSY
jgi:hypothetical protein